MSVKDPSKDTPFDEIDNLGCKLFITADIVTKKTLIANMLGVSGETPEMTQLHTFMLENTNTHKELAKEVKTLKYGLVVLAGSFLGSETLKTLLELFGG